jgi:hypothetical protein
MKIRVEVLNKKKSKMNAKRSRVDCTVKVKRLHDDCAAIATWCCSDCTATTKRLYSDYNVIARPLRRK